MAVIVWYPQMAFFLSVCTPGIASSYKDTLVLLDERLTLLKGPISKYSYIGVRALTYEFWENIDIQCIAIMIQLYICPYLGREKEKGIRQTHKQISNRY